MKGRGTRVRLTSTVIWFALVLVAAPAAQAGTAGERGTPAVRSTEAAVRVAHSPGPVTFGRGSRRELVEDEQGAPTMRHGGFHRRDAVIGLAIAVGVVLFGIWGYVPVGLVLLAIEACFSAGAWLVARRALIRSARPSTPSRLRPAIERERR